MANAQTEHYGLNQWSPGDPVLREEFNQDNAKIDAALDTKGNCRITTGSYVGTGEFGEEHPNTIQLPFPAQMVWLDVSTLNRYNSATEHYILHRQAQHFGGMGTSIGTNVLTWTDTSVSWYYSTYDKEGAKIQFNEKNKTYHYIVIG